MKILAVLAIVATCFVVGVHELITISRTIVVPEGLGVQRVMSSDKRASGALGPSGHTKRLSVFAMTALTAQAIERGGVAYLGQRAPIDRKGRLIAWRETPVKGPLVNLTSAASSISECRNDICPRIADYLNSYGYGGLRAEPGTYGMIDGALAAPGSFHASANGGWLIVVPSRRRIVWAVAN